MNDFTELFRAPLELARRRTEITRKLAAKPHEVEKNLSDFYETRERDMKTLFAFADTLDEDGFTRYGPPFDEFRAVCEELVAAEEGLTRVMATISENLTAEIERLRRGRDLAARYSRMPGLGPAYFDKKK